MLTRSEIIFNCKIAARGAGYSWGLASDAAAATLALIEAGEDGFGALIEILEFAENKAQPLNIENGEPICGLTLGAYRADLGISDEIPNDVVGSAITQALTSNLAKGHARPDQIPQEVLDFFQKALVPESDVSRRGAGEA